MKFKLFAHSLLSVSALLTLASHSTPSASAACVMTDVAAQVAIHGSKKPSQQTNNVDMQNEGACLGNTTTNTGTQVYAGPDDVEQTRNSSHFNGGSTDDKTEIDGPVIRVPVSVPVDIYSPAYDQEFLGDITDF
ncbi:hypothetical protein AVDCRST_MAG81-3870 [uncultured Synechococcales cyanobacterium]|uniref:Uncharacterized protein n=1 Tax=uncultured Synechococcales cyanobacterium TaxID=1936017 RepID=A0A6J4VVL9_9CYAN|nr:hypothetical protein AVDCRST_MAG81-3870 [uncultured Synechococcales cyanobacterium]